MTKLPISVFIIAKNEEFRITKAINSVIDWVDEVIVIDSGSQDNTVVIAQNLKAKVIYNEWCGYVQQKIFGENLCSHSWILNIDADEEVSDALKEEIITKFTANKFLAYYCKIVILHRHDVKARFLAPITKVVRFYHKDYAGFKYGDLNSFCHDSVCLNIGKISSDQISEFNNMIYHRSINSLEQAVAKANFYSNLQAEELFLKKRKISRLRIAFEPIWWFLKVYFLRRYFVYGFSGFIDSMVLSFARFLRLAKLREKYLEKENKSLTN